MSVYPESRPAARPMAQRPFDGFAIAAFVLAFIPGGITYILSLVFGLRAYRSTRDGETRGHGLAVAALIIGPAVGSLLFALYFALATLTFTLLPTAASTVSPAQYSQSVDGDVLNTVGEIEQAMQTSPGLDVTQVPQVKHGDTLMTISNQGGGIWSVRAASTKFGNPATDYVSYDSSTNQFTVHGKLAQYRAYITAHSDVAQVYVP